MRRSCPWLAIFILAQALMSFSATGALHLATFTAGTNTYTNVAITASSGGRILVDHGRGIASARVRDLDLDVQQQLVEAGLVSPMLAKEIERDIAKRDADKRKAERTSAGAAAGLTLEDAETTSIARLVTGQLERQAQESNFKPELEWFLDRFGERLVEGVSAALFFLGILRWFLFYRICKNATGKGSLLVFIPVFRWIALAAAAAMTKRWLLIPLFGIAALFFPPPLVERFPWAATAYLGLLAVLWTVTLLLYMVWCVRVCRNVGRSAVWSIFLFFPLLDYVALFVLAFGGGKSDTFSMGATDPLKDPALAI